MDLIRLERPGDNCLHATFRLGARSTKARWTKGPRFSMVKSPLWDGLNVANHSPVGYVTASWIRICLLLKYLPWKFMMILLGCCFFLTNIFWVRLISPWFWVTSITIRFRNQISVNSDRTGWWNPNPNPKIPSHPSRASFFSKVSIKHSMEITPCGNPESPERSGILLGKSMV